MVLRKSLALLLIVMGAIICTASSEGKMSIMNTHVTLGICVLIRSYAVCRDEMHGEGEPQGEKLGQVEIK
jgi:hypothetical protein